MFRFENSEYLYLLGLIPVFFVLFAVFRFFRARGLKKFASSKMLEKLQPEGSKYKPYLKFTFIMLSLACVILAIARPQMGTKLEEVKREGVEVIVALDVSNSMLSDDIKPNRLERAKFLVNRLLDKLTNDKFGLIVFAGQAFSQLPLTTDYSAAKLILNSVDSDIIATQGTAIGGAIELSAKSFSKKEEKINRVLIVITDGENHEDDAVDAAKALADEGVIIHTIGMGTINGGPIPIKTANGTDFIKEGDGSTVITKLNGDALKEISDAGKGSFIYSGNSDPDLNSLVKEIAKMEKKTFGEKRFSDYDDKFQYFLLGAIGFALLESLISGKKNYFFVKIAKFIGGRK